MADEKRKKQDDVGEPEEIAAEAAAPEEAEPAGEGDAEPAAAKSEAASEEPTAEAEAEPAASDAASDEPTAEAEPAASDEPTAEAEPAAEVEPVAASEAASDEPAAEAKPVAASEAASDEPAAETEAEPAAASDAAPAEPTAEAEPVAASETAPAEPTAEAEPAAASDAAPAEPAAASDAAPAEPTAASDAAPAEPTAEAEPVAASEAAPAEPTAEAEPAAASEAAPAEPTAEAETDEDEEERAPRVKPEIPGADLEVDIVREGEDALTRGEYGEYVEGEEEPTGEAAEGDDQELPQPIAAASIDLAAGARYRATGKRKTAVARVILKPGNGVYAINDRTLEQHFPRFTLQRQIRQALETVGLEEKMDVVAKMHGGGVSAQADALRHGISRALVEADPNLRSELKRRGFLTRDARVKERKKAGLKKARKRPQFSKR